jgi:hypothetical protein
MLMTLPSGARTKNRRTPQALSLSGAKCPGQRSSACSVELLTAYSHTAQAADLNISHTAALSRPARTPRPTATSPWNLRDRLTERDSAKLITAYRDGATAGSLATAYALSLSSVKRLLRTAGVRRTPPIRQSERAMPAVTHP